MGDQRCRWAVTFGSLATRCDQSLGHPGAKHEGPGLSQFPYQRIEWFAGDKREFETDRPDDHAWEARDV